MHKLSSKFYLIFFLMFFALGSTALTSYIAIDTQKQHTILTELLSKQVLIVERVTSTTINAAELALLTTGDRSKISKADIETVSQYTGVVDFMLNAFKTKSYPINAKETIQLKFRTQFEKTFIASIDESLAQWNLVKESDAYLMDDKNLSDPQKYALALEEYKVLNAKVTHNIDYVSKICRDEADAKKMLSDRMQLGSFGLSFLILIYLIYLLRDGLYKPLLEIKQVFNKMGKGDFNVEFKRDKRDEFKDLYENFNSFIVNLKEIFELEDKIIMEDELDVILLHIHDRFSKVIGFNTLGITYKEQNGQYVLKHIKDRSVCETILSSKPDPIEAFILHGNRIDMPIVINERNLGSVFFEFDNDEKIDDSTVNFIKLLQFKLSFAFYKTFLFKDLLSIVTEGLADMTEARDPETGNHLVRMSNYSQIITKKLFEMGTFPETINPSFIHNIKITAPMHDIGKVGVPDAVLLKPGKLSFEEFEVMKTHAARGGDVLSSMDKKFDQYNIKYFRIAADIALGHQEKFDGSGYPCGLVGEEIPLCARITAIADVFDALTSKRPYKDAFDLEKSYAILKESSGTHFDPRVVEAFFSAINEIETIYHSYREV